jgi:hypothetical protein
MKKYIFPALFVAMIERQARASIFGEEMVPLMQLVAGQVQELKALTDQIGIARDQQETLIQLNQGINNAVGQIQSIQALMERARGLDPTSVRSLSDLNDLLVRANQVKLQVNELLRLKVSLANEAIGASALQSDTAYRMGQEMTLVGSSLAKESEQASPGRAAQITAASNSAQMLATGVELQTLAQLLQIQAMNLDLQKAQIERDLQNEQARREMYEKQLGKKREKSKP